MAITQRDIALKAGVSQKTVSFYFSNQSKIASKTCERIKQIIEESNYCLNSAAQSIRCKKFYRIALVVVMQKNEYDEIYYPPHLFTYINNIAAELALNGFSLSLETFIIDSKTQMLESEPKFFKTLSVDGIIGIAGSYVPAVVDDSIAKMNVPVVWLNRSQISEGIESIDFDEESHGQLIGEYLVAKKHKKVVWLGPDFNSEIHTHYSSYLRYKGVKTVCDQNGIELVGCFNDDREKLIPVVADCFAQHPAQAVVSYNFDYHDTALHMLMHYKLKYPAKVDLVKFASLWEIGCGLANHYTMLLLPEEELSKNGVKYILSKLNNKENRNLLKANIGKILYRKTEVDVQ